MPQEGPWGDGRGLPPAAFYDGGTAQTIGFSECVTLPRSQY